MKMRSAALALACLTLAGTALPAHAQSTRAAKAEAAQSATPASATLLVAHPVLFALTTALAEGTALRVERAAPANLPATRHASFFSGRGGAALAKAAGQADAVVAMRSVWHDDPLFPMARRSNIRLVEIDAAQPLDGALSGIALQSGQRGGSEFAAYPWLSMANLGRMADIVAADLGQLAPQDEARIDQNLAAIKRELVTLNANSQAALAAAENVSVLSLSERVPYLVSAFNLDLVDTVVHTDAQWTPEQLAALTEQVKASGVAAVLTHGEAGDALRQAVEQGGAKLVALQTEGNDPVGDLRVNAERLQAALLP